jgi:hypothetical protein
MHFFFGPAKLPRIFTGATIYVEVGWLAKGFHEE